MEVLNKIANFLNTNWDMIGLAFTALGLSALLQKFKNKLKIKSPKVLLGLTSVMSFATAAIPAMLGYLSANPQVLGKYTAFTFTFMTLLYRYVVQPTSAFMADVREYKQAKEDGVTGVDAHVSVQVVPKVEAPVIPKEADF